MANNRSQAMLEIQQVHLVLEDIILFLDTHPTDATALNYYDHFKQLNDQLMEEYTMQFGPITADNVNVTNSWAWVETPWPWEGEI